MQRTSAGHARLGENPKGNEDHAMQSMAMSFIRTCNDALGITWKRNASVLVLSFSLLALAYPATSQSLLTDSSSRTVSASTPQAVDPNKGSSELNHHIAGWALVGVGLLQLASLGSSRRRALRYVWPALFVLAALFLALWSDAEIWPRGNLDWSWLFRHDAEARQHKIYAFLLSAIGIVEYLRISGSLPRVWKTWAFPVLAVIGAGLLLIHDHTGGSGARSPEAQAYLVNPALDVDGEARQNALIASEATSQDQHQSMYESSEKAMDVHGLESGSMQMSHSHIAMDASPLGTVRHDHHEHHMTVSMLLVEREHMGFMIVGLGIALFKFLVDREFFQKHMFLYTWPSGMVLLGFMLVLYRE